MRASLLPTVALVLVGLSCYYRSPVVERQWRSPEREPFVRVRLTVAMPVTMSSTQPLKLACSRFEREVPAGATVTLTPDAVMVAGSRWRKLDDTLRVAVGPDGLIRVGDRSYRGGIIAFRSPADELCVVNVLGMEEYLFGVVPCEIGPISQQTLEAVKAQAVAARSFTLSRFGRRKGLGHDLFDSYARDQEYRGAGRETELGRQAVLATAGEVLVHHDQPIEALYHANCGGHTADGSQPYLMGVQDAPDRGRPAYCGGNPNSSWRVTLPLDSLNAVVSRQAGSKRRVRSVRLEADSRSGRVKYAHFATDKGAVRMHGSDVRFKLGLKSQNVTMSLRGGSVVVVGKGWGHGVGLCQDGAIGMARAGRDYRQILHHYYSGVSLKRRY